ncbi:MAG: Asp-tRNA(Asn)/Glu-tRNA(Gln) amidotransferase subunit GatC [Pseudomonadota bacterium]|nr:Asp-tRNA(Asn)/Glu-tRNA(Gln) amidotransferase subunit GatC [Pseudomonadota bacterium]
MAMTEKDVLAVAHLARLALRPEDIPLHAESLSKILSLVAQMDAVDTRDIQPMAHPLDISQPMRDDKVTEANVRDKMQQIAPLAEKGLYLVPQVIEAPL